MDVSGIIRALGHTAEARIIVFGDYALDKYFFIDPENDEPSAETGLPAYFVGRKHLSAGVGGTIVQNLRALGADVTCIGIVGNDGEGCELLSILESIGAHTEYMVRTDSLFTCAYIKPMRRQSDGSYSELNRMDIRNLSEPPEALQQELLSNLEKAVPDADAVIVTDQFYQRNMGAVTDTIRKALGEMAAKFPDKLFYADSRAFISEYDNMALKCNNLEAFSKFEGGDGDPDDLQQVADRGTAIQKRTGKEFYITCGSKGIVTFDENGYSVVPAFVVSGAIDIVGAGDATNAALVLGRVLGLTMEEAATLACAVSSITIQQIGTTGTASPEQVIDRLTNGKRAAL